MHSTLQIVPSVTENDMWTNPDGDAYNSVRLKRLRWRTLPQIISGAKADLRKVIAATTRRMLNSTVLVRDAIRFYFTLSRPALGRNDI